MGILLIITKIYTHMMKFSMAAICVGLSAGLKVEVEKMTMTPSNI